MVKSHKYYCQYCKYSKSFGEFQHFLYDLQKSKKLQKKLLTKWLCCGKIGKHPKNKGVLQDLEN